MPSFFQCSLMAGKSSVRSRNVYPLNPPVCVERTADGRTAVSIPIADRIGRATVSEHCPTQDMSCIVKIRFWFIVYVVLFGVLCCCVAQRRSVCTLRWNASCCSDAMLCCVELSLRTTLGYVVPSALALARYAWLRRAYALRWVLSCLRHW